MVALSQRWIGVLALLVMGLVSGCFSDEEEASPTEEADTSESAEAQESADGENTSEDGGEGGEPDVDEPDVDESDVDEPDVAEPDVDDPDVDEVEEEASDVADPDTTELSQEGMTCPEIFACMELYAEFQEEEPGQGDPYLELCLASASSEGLNAYETMLDCIETSGCSVWDKVCILDVCSAQDAVCQEQLEGQGALFSCSAGSCSSFASGSDEARKCTMIALAENSSNFFEGSLEKAEGQFQDQFLVQSGYPCRRARFVKRTKEVMSEDQLTTPWSSPWECQLKPSSYFEACAAPFLGDEEPKNDDIDWSCFDVSNWFVSCEQVMNYTCPNPGEDPNTLEGCENSGTPVGCDGIPDKGMCDGDVIMSCAKEEGPIKTTKTFDCGQFVDCTCGVDTQGWATCIGPCEGF